LAILVSFLLYNAARIVQDAGAAMAVRSAPTARSPGLVIASPPSSTT
jgi:hypothetical protein